MGERRGYFILIGSVLLTIVIAILLSSPHDILSADLYLIDEEPPWAISSGVPVKTSLNLNDTEYLENFPMQIKDWHGYITDASEAKELLEAEYLLLRTYVKKDFSSPTFLCMVKSTRQSNIHPPTVCYIAQGYEIEEDSKEIVYIKDASWIQRKGDIDINTLPEWMQKDVESTPDSQIGYWLSVKKLVVSKRSEDKTTERRLALYFFIRTNSYTNQYHLLRVSALIPVQGSYDGQLSLTKELMEEVVPLLFNPSEKGDEIYLMHLASTGVLGYFAIILIIGVPSAILAYPYYKKRKQAGIPEKTL